LPLSLTDALRAHVETHHGPVAVRAAEELFERWVDGLLYSEPGLGKSLTFWTGGDLAHPLIFRTLRLAYPPRPVATSVRGTKCAVTPAVVEIAQSAQNWLDEMSHAMASDGHDLLMGTLRKYVERSKAGHFAWYRFSA
jgi:hypothetical protein